MKKKIWNLSLLTAGLFTTSINIACAADQGIIIGVSKYQNPQITALQGVGHDVDAMVEAYQKSFGLSRNNIRALKDADATRANILQALDALKDKTKAGDSIYLYFSGHGTSGRDRANAELSQLIPHQSGALLPYDTFYGYPAQKMYDSLVVGARDIRPRLSELEAGGRNVYAFFDACFSGQAIRSAAQQQSGPLQSRYLRLPEFPKTRSASGFQSDDPDLCGFQCGTSKETTVAKGYPYSRVTYLAAASETEAAIDISGLSLNRYPTRSGKPHGAFTDSLLRVLHGEVPVDFDGNGQLSMREIHRGVSCFMERRNYPHSPQILPSISKSGSSLTSDTITKNWLPAAKSHRGGLNVALQGIDVSGLPEGIAKVQNGADIQVIYSQGETRYLSGAGDYLGSSPAAGKSKSQRKQDIKDRLELFAWVDSLRQIQCDNRGPWTYLSMKEDGYGSDYKIGQSVDFEFGADKRAQLLLLGVNPSGTISVFYPANETELGLVNPSERVRFPMKGEIIEASPPAGTDFLTLFAFSQETPLVRQLMGREFQFSDPLIQDLRQLLVRQNKQVGTTVVDLRIHEK